jgi:hypothetical protein
VLLQRIDKGQIEPVRRNSQRSGEIDPVRTVIRTTDLAALATERGERPRYLRHVLAGQKLKARERAGGPETVQEAIKTNLGRRRRGPRATVRERVIRAMKADLNRGRFTVDELSDRLEKQLEADYGVSRDTARKARNAVLAELGAKSKLSTKRD